MSTTIMAGSPISWVPGLGRLRDPKDSEGIGVGGFRDLRGGIRAPFLLPVRFPRVLAKAKQK